MSNTSLSSLSNLGSLNTGIGNLNGTIGKPIQSL